MAVEEEVDVGRRSGWGDVDEVDAEGAALEVQGEGPVCYGVAIAAYDFEGFSGGAEFIENPLGADVAEVPDFVGGGELLDECGGQFVVGIGDDGDVGRGRRLH